MGPHIDTLQECVCVCVFVFVNIVCVFSWEASIGDIRGFYSRQLGIYISYRADVRLFRVVKTMQNAPSIDPMGI